MCLGNGVEICVYSQLPVLPSAETHYNMSAMSEEMCDEATKGKRLLVGHGSNLAALTHLRQALALCHIMLYRTADPTKHSAEWTEVGTSLTQGVNICEMHHD